MSLWQILKKYIYNLSKFQEDFHLGSILMVFNSFYDLGINFFLYFVNLEKKSALKLKIFFAFNAINKNNLRVAVFALAILVVSKGHKKTLT